MIIETNRLILREYTMDDFNALKDIISDSETMKFYPKPYDDEGVNRWINWNITNYQTFGFGLWAVVLKENGKMIGDCGITMQLINKKIRPEIGYHFNKAYHNKGYATEAAKSCKDFIFTNTTFKEIYSYMNKDNIASEKIAIHNKMHLVEEYIDPKDFEALKVYRITKSEWKEEKNDSRNNN